ncbi:MAG: aspartate--tRNA(Asn) ligase, partial [Candidatus Aenigmarchaeota archaeon]|nr:aspartate--tRNA(Asn) ligase [Candidatus Aenigmarchaeota archaeon]
RYDERVKNVKDKGIDPKTFDHLRFFKYGMPPHGGLALGIERLTEKILNLDNVREATLTPRDPERLKP